MDYVLTSNGSPFTKCPNPTMLKPLQMLAKSCKNRSMCDHVWSDVGAVPSFFFLWWRESCTWKRSSQFSHWCAYPRLWSQALVVAERRRSHRQRAGTCFLQKAAGLSPRDRWEVTEEHREELLLLPNTFVVIYILLNHNHNTNYPNDPDQKFTYPGDWPW